MTTLENYQLVHPELLTEDVLLQVLRDRCIEAPILKSSSKTELVEIFKRVALPLPQRNYDSSTHLGRKLIGIMKSKGQPTIDSPNIDSTLSMDKNNGFGAERIERNMDRLKPPLVGPETISKKIRLTKTSNASCDTIKRTSQTALPEQSGRTKRQKITWP